MNIHYREVSFVEFTTLDCAPLFYEDKTAVRFGVVTNGVKNYKFSWQSNLITPVLMVSESNMMCYLGVDLMFSVIDFTETTFTYTLQLNCFFYDIISVERQIWVITELEILVIEKINHRIVKTISLPSYFKEIITTSDSYYRMFRRRNLYCLTKNKHPLKLKVEIYASIPH